MNAKGKGDERVAPEDLDEEIEEELVADMTGDDSTVTIGDRDFELEVPATKHIIWFINAFSRLARKSQGRVVDMLGSPSPLDVIFSIGEALTEDDLIAFGIAALQFDDRKKGRKFLIEHGVPLAQIVEAVGISVKKSSPLMQQLKNVFEGLVGRGTIEALVETTVRESLQ